MNTEKKIPLRKCAGCNERKPKKDLVRILRTENGIIIDLTGKQNGRGAYLCHNNVCLEHARKTKSIERALKEAVPDEIYDQLKEEFQKTERIKREKYRMIK